MSYNFNSKDINQFLDINSFNKKIDFPKETGHMFIEKSVISSEIILFKNSIHAKKDISLFQEESYSNTLYLNITLDGELFFQGFSKKDSFLTKKSHTTMFLSNPKKGSTNIKRDSYIKSLSILINKSFLSPLVLNKIEKKEKHSRIFPSSPRVQQLAKELYISNLNDDIEKIFIQSKILEILYCEINTSSEINISQTGIKFSAYDIEALHQAKDIMQNSIQKPPSLIELSKIVKLNEFKLKFGFKKLFGLAPYEISREYKMIEAKKLLESSEFNVGEISKKVGYKHIQTFSTAFTKHYGIKPKDIMKSRTYYY